MPARQDRFKAYEKTLRMEADLAFQVTMHRNKLLGYWAAGMLGLEPRDAVDYARTVAAADMEEPGDDDVVRKVHDDLLRKGHWTSEAEIRAQLKRLHGEARREIIGPPPLQIRAGG